MKKLFLSLALLTSISSFAGGSTKMNDFSVKINNNATDLVSTQEIVNILDREFGKQGCKVSYINGLSSIFQSGGVEVKVWKSGSLSVRANYSDTYQIITINHADGGNSIGEKLEAIFESTESNLLNSIKCN